jgi:chemotaxis protein MotD
VQTHVAAAAVAAVAAAVTAGAVSRRTRFEVRLDPGELGRVDVRLDIAHDGRLATRLIVDRPETLDLLKQDARELTRTLENAGFQLGQGGLSLQLRDGGGRGAWPLPDATPGSPPAQVESETQTPVYVRPSPVRAGGVDVTA